MDYDGMETTLCVMCLRITVYIISVFLIIASLTPSTQLDALAALAAGQRSAQGRSSYMSLAAKQLHLGLLWLVWVDGLRRESTGRPDFEEWSTLSPSNAFRRHSCQGWRYSTRHWEHRMSTSPTCLVHGRWAWRSRITKGVERGWGPRMSQVWGLKMHWSTGAIDSIFPYTSSNPKM